jgi:hypothetical protein
MYGVKPRNVGIALAEGFRGWGKWALLLSNYTLAFALQLRTTTEISFRAAE